MSKKDNTLISPTSPLSFINCTYIHLSINITAKDMTASGVKSAETKLNGFERSMNKAQSKINKLNNYLFQLTTAFWHNFKPYLG